jgi:hypothetical protein
MQRRASIRAAEKRKVTRQPINTPRVVPRRRAHRAFPPDRWNLQRK